MMQKALRRIKREPARRVTGPTRSAIARRWLIKPDLDKPFVVELYISPTRKHMHTAANHIDGQNERPDFAGMVRHYSSRATGRKVVLPGQIIAKMFLNADDIRKNGGEIVAHECTHAGMAWSRLRKAQLSVMPGEEVLCYAVGVLAKQVNRICYKMGIWR